ncbi:hypothetical protein BJ998_001374 [Kutzneria kofuensis]|uniref:Uncharacterized protein n=1 Tax=Kutzneria kofuensis TaxID=103725 RepID=A0A7W9KDH6_9PSEU|nr:hypothetical protein [Kutzneria kofuensis]
MTSPTAAALRPPEVDVKRYLDTTISNPHD